MTDKLLAVTNGIVFTGAGFIHDSVVLVKGNHVMDIIHQNNIPDEAVIFDAEEHYVVPGFIDLQIYGGGGRLFSANPSKEAMDEIADALVRTGTTNFMITMATNAMEVVDRALEVLSDYHHPALLGLHLEGPYLNPAKRGAHPMEYIRTPELSEIKSLLDRAMGCVKMMTIAPERFDEEVVALLLDRGVLLSAGHSDATFEQAEAGFSKGVRAATHLFNAMSPLHHRNPGLPGATFQSDRAMASIIADGIHVDYQTLSISKKLLGERLFLITDAVAEAHEGVYTHVFKGDRYTLPDGTLSGSSLTMMQAVGNCVRYAGIVLEEALRMASLYPAMLIGSEHLGKIAPGYLANLVIFDQQYEIAHVFVEGKPNPSDAP